MSVTRSVVLGRGSYLPSRVLTNSQLSRMVDTSDEWITQRTGICERHIAGEGETTADMALKAARAALDAAQVDAQSIDLIVSATSTPDNTFPASAVSVQAGLGITHGAAFDVQAVCSGFVYGLATVDGLAQDRRISTCLGDRCRNLLSHHRLEGPHVHVSFSAMEPVPLCLNYMAKHGTREDRGILAVSLRSDGRHQSKLLRRRRAILDTNRRAPAHGGHAPYSNMPLQ